MQAYNHRTSIQIRFSDVDMMGHVNNATYLHYVESARMDYFINVLKENDWKKYGLIVGRTEIDYLMPIHLGDKLEIYTACESIGNKSIRFIYELVIENVHGVQTAAKCAMTAVSFDYIENKSSAVSEAWVKALENKEGKVLRKS